MTMEAEFGMMHLYIKEHHALLARYQKLKEKHGKTAPIRHQEKHSSTNTLILDSSHQRQEMTLLFNTQSWWFLIVATLGN